jgi:hypothetical protein
VVKMTPLTSRPQPRIDLDATLCIEACPKKTAVVGSAPGTAQARHNRSLPVYVQRWTCRRIPITDAMCQTRESSMQYEVIEEEVNDHDTFHKP